MWIRSLGHEGPLQKEVATQSSILAWKIPWTEEPGRLQSMGSQRSRTRLLTKTAHTATTDDQKGRRCFRMSPEPFYFFQSIFTVYFHSLF